MNNIERLYKISKKKERYIIGLMSGTSLDGLDIAFCKFTGAGLHTSVELLQFETIPYKSPFQEDIRKIFSKKQIDLELLCLMNEKIALVHADYINTTLQKWGISKNEVDAIASHGQTIFHSPFIKHKNPDFTNATLQIGDGDHIAVKTGILTLSDFRQKNIAAGAEGAPLAVYGDYLLFRNDINPVVLLNIGGIANITYLPGKESKDSLFSSDLGPGNTLIDQYMQREYQLPFDKDAFYSKQGSVHQKLLNLLLCDDFFESPLPKSTGPELFNLEYLDIRRARIEENISHPDILATLCEFSALVIAKEVKKLDPALQLVVSGGGIHNPLLMENIRKHLPDIRQKDITAYGITADSKEAILFALLANETLQGETIDFKTSSIPNVCMGKVSFPK